MPTPRSSMTGRSGRVGSVDDGDDGRSVVPVEARGIRWATLVALAGPGHPAGRRAVLEQGAHGARAGATVRPGRRGLGSSRSPPAHGCAAGRRYGSAEEMTALLGAARLDLPGAALLGLATDGRRRRRGGGGEARPSSSVTRPVRHPSRGGRSRGGMDAGCSSPCPLRRPSSAGRPSASARVCAVTASDPRVAVGPRVDGGARGPRRCPGCWTRSSRRSTSRTWAICPRVGALGRPASAPALRLLAARRPSAPREQRGPAGPRSRRHPPVDAICSRQWGRSSRTRATARRRPPRLRVEVGVLPAAGSRRTGPRGGPGRRRGARRAPPRSRVHRAHRSPDGPGTH